MIKLPIHALNNAVRKKILLQQSLMVLLCRPLKPGVISEKIELLNKNRSQSVSPWIPIYNSTMDS